MSANHSAESAPPSSLGNASSGLVTLPSAHGAAETIARLERVLAEKGIQIFARIDHAGAAQEVGLPLRFTRVLVFGNPRAGTPLMQARQSIGLDLPLKVLVWEDEAGRAWLTYNEPAYLAQRHEVRDREEAVKALSTGLKAIVRAATEP
jgi:uncharacterized protein (DUF302 family)